MTKVQALKLKTGDRVLWNKSRHDRGTVLENPNQAACINIQWDNGETGSMHLADMDMVSLADPS